MKALIGKVGFRPCTWSEWVACWNREGISLYEQMGLLHHGYHIPIAYDVGGFAMRVDRVAMYLQLANQAGYSREYLEAGGKDLAQKAKQMLCKKLFVGRSSDNPLLFSSGRQRLLPLVCDLFCDRFGETGNWEFRKSGISALNISMGAYFLGLLRQTLRDDRRLRMGDLPAGRSLIGRRIILTGFLETPNEFFSLITSGFFGAEAGSPFCREDFHRIIEEVAGKNYRALAIPELLESESFRSELDAGVLRLIGDRVIGGVIKHREFIQLVGAFLEEQDM